MNRQKCSSCWTPIVRTSRGGPGSSAIAGEGVAGAILNNPTTLAVDSVGNLYAGDWSGFIRKVWVKDGGTTIVAGTGILGYGGDFGQATNARFGKAVSIALDSAGN